MFSLLFSLTLFPATSVVVGLGYLFRLVAYASIFYLVRKNNKDLVYKALILVSVFIAIFGWVQYFFYPDFRLFSVWGWDKHLYRLIGTFMDPGFTGILLTLGFILSLGLYLKRKSRLYLAISVLLFTATLFTYSRASILALFVSAGRRLGGMKRGKGMMTFAFLLLLALFLLPRPGGAGVMLERLFSVYARLRNYRQTIYIWKQSPVFGVGFNNLCIAKNIFIGKTADLSHSCSGSDSSILMILATTGVVGLLIFIEFIKKVIYSIRKNSLGNVLLASMLAIFVHSLFVNSLFYPFVLAWMAILLGICLKE